MSFGGFYNNRYSTMPSPYYGLWSQGSAEWAGRGRVVRTRNLDEQREPASRTSTEVARIKYLSSGIVRYHRHTTKARESTPGTRFLWRDDGDDAALTLLKCARTSPNRSTISGSGGHHHRGRIQCPESMSIRTRTPHLSDASSTCTTLVGDELYTRTNRFLLINVQSYC